MSINQYYEINCVHPGGLYGDAFVFTNWNGVEVIVSGTDIFVTPRIGEWLMSQGLTELIRRWPVTTDQQYYEICGLQPPAELYEISVASTVYDSDLYFQDGSLIVSDAIASGLKTLSKSIKPSAILPISYKFQAKQNPLDLQHQEMLGHWGEGALHWQAAKGAPLGVVETVDAQDDFGFTALHDACCAGNLAAIAELINAGASLDLQTRHPFSLIDFTLLFDHAHILAYLMENNLIELDDHFIERMFSYKSVQCLHNSLGTGIDVNFRESNTDPTYLMRAIEWKNLEIIKTLLELGANPKAERGGVHQTTVLGKALDSWNPEIVEIVLRYGANANDSILRRTIEPPLIRSLMCDSDKKIVESLLQHGADLNLPYRKGTILDRVKKLAKSPSSDIRREKCRIVLKYAESNLDNDIY